jgi:DNA-binding NarL/FixJ family response regulator
MADHCAILANAILERNALAHKGLRSIRTSAPDLIPFTSFLTALLNREPERMEASLREMRLAGVAGVARYVESVVKHGTRAQEPSEPEVLTPAELDVLRAMARGLSNQAIADAQRRAINTVRSHVSAILRKLGCASRGEAVAAARRRELI